MENRGISNFSADLERTHRMNGARSSRVDFPSDHEVSRSTRLRKFIAGFRCRISVLRTSLTCREPSRVTSIGMAFRKSRFTITTKRRVPFSSEEITAPLPSDFSAVIGDFGA